MVAVQMVVLEGQELQVREIKVEIRIMVMVVVLPMAREEEVLVPQEQILPLINLVLAVLGWHPTFLEVLYFMPVVAVEELLVMKQFKLVEMVAAEVEETVHNFQHRVRIIMVVVVAAAELTALFQNPVLKVDLVLLLCVTLLLKVCLMLVIVMMLINRQRTFISK